MNTLVPGCGVVFRPLVPLRAHAHRASVASVFWGDGRRLGLERGGWEGDLFSCLMHLLLERVS